MVVTVTDVKAKYELDLLKIPGVYGVAADLQTNEIVVYVESVEVCERIPKRIEGYPVRCEVTGPIGALRR